MSKIIDKVAYQKKILKKIVLTSDPNVHILFTPIKIGSLMDLNRTIQQETENSVNVYNGICKLIVDHAVNEDGDRIFTDQADLEKTLDGNDIRHIGEKLAEMSGLVEDQKKGSVKTPPVRKSKGSESV